MEMQLQELIEQIKKEGVEQAETEAASILESAKAEAAKIISDAKAEAEKLILDAKEENARLVRVSEDSIRQSGRNLLISFRESINKELDAIIGAEVSGVYSSEAVSEVIVKAVSAVSENVDVDDISVILNKGDLEKLESSLLSALKDKISKGVTVKPNDNFNGGFRIAINNGSAFYDYSKEAVTEMLSTYLNPKVTALMKEAD